MHFFLSEGPVSPNVNERNLMMTWQQQVYLLFNVSDETARQTAAAAAAAATWTYVPCHCSV